MKANYQLIKVLREAADYIENNPEKYYWGSSDTCNCGIVAKVATNTLNEETHHLFSWESISYNPDHPILDQSLFCSSTGLTYKDVFNTLLKLGFELEDFSRLEYLKSKTGRSSSSHSIRSAVIKWIREEADSLEQKLISLPTVNVENKQVVSVHL